jgi:EpsI family protein
MPAASVNWRRIAALIGVLIAVLILYWPATQSLGALWLDGPRRNYTHGFLVLGISLWLMWRSRVQLGLRDPQSLPPTWRGALLLGILGAVVFWQFLYRAGIQLGTEFLLLPLLWMTVLMLFGRIAARAMFLPLSYLGFAMTFWDFLNPLAQASSVYAVRLMLRLVGVPSHFNGNVVEIPSGAFEIMGGCSGLHFIIVALAMAVLIGELRADGWRMRLRWLLIAGVLAVLVNWVRVFTVIVAGHLTHMQHYLVSKSHYGFGWLLFAFALLVLFAIERRTPLPALSRESPAPTAGENTSISHPGILAGWAIATCLVLAFPLVQNLVIDARLAGWQAKSAAPFNPKDRGNWKIAQSPDSDWQPIQLHADQEQRQTFTSGAAAVEVYRAQYHEQRQGKKLGGYANRLQGDAQTVEEATQVAGSRMFSSMLIEMHGRRSVLWITYRAGSRSFTSATRAQLWYSWLTLRSMRSAASEAIALRAVCDSVDCRDAGALLERFVTDVGGIP